MPNQLMDGSDFFTTFFFELNFLFFHHCEWCLFLRLVYFFFSRCYIFQVHLVYGFKVSQINFLLLPSKSKFLKLLFLVNEDVWFGF